MISREKRAQIKELKDELNNKLAKGFSKNPNMENFYFKADNDRYISIDQFKMKPKWRISSRMYNSFTNT